MKLLVNFIKYLFRVGWGFKGGVPLASDDNDSHDSGGNCLCLLFLKRNKNIFYYIYME